MTEGIGEKIALSVSLGYYGKDEKCYINNVCI